MRRSSSPCSSRTSSSTARSCPTSRRRWTGRPRWPAARLTLNTSLGVDLSLRVVSAPDAASWAAVLPAGHAGRRLSDARPVRRDLAHQPREPDERPCRRPAPRGDHRCSARTARASRATPWQADCCGRWPTSTRVGRCGGCSTTRQGRARRALQVPGQRLRDALTTIGPLTELDETDSEARPRWRDPAAAAVPVGDRRPAIARPGAAGRS